MGFGHRVYKNFDPRAKIIKKATYDVLDKLGIQDKALDIAMQLEKVALEDDYFIERQLYPNVDFYSGIIYRALGIPTEMFTVAVRGISTATTGGIANPLVSTVEWVGAVLLSVLSLLVPVLVVIVGIILAIWAVRWFKRKKQEVISTPL
jgi:hypothetical protein